MKSEREKSLGNKIYYFGEGERAEFEGQQISPACLADKDSETI